MKSLLVIGHVWPEPNSSAAGKRMLQLLDFFKPEGYNICFASTAAKSEFAVLPEFLEITAKKIILNDPSFDDFLVELKPEIVIFDRFMTEEQFGWRVDKFAENAVKILDTEDLHFLRDARLKAFKQGISSEEIYMESELSKREIASIYRCDLSLIISEFEMKLLQEKFKIPENILFYLPFMLEKISAKEIQNLPNFEDRKDFVTIGNFLHEPNRNAVMLLKEKIWPIIKRKLPEAKVNIYGAYPTQQMLELNDTKSGFLVHGRAKDSSAVMKSARLCLAPLQVGAGLKGKLVESMKCGTPSITSEIGAEGIPGKLPWNGIIENENEAFAQAAVELYVDKNSWTKFQQNGFCIINERFSAKYFRSEFRRKLGKLNSGLLQHRKENFTGAMLKHHLHRSTYFMAKFIEEKNKTKNLS